MLIYFDVILSNTKHSQQNNVLAATAFILNPLSKSFQSVYQSPFLSNLIVYFSLNNILSLYHKYTLVLLSTIIHSLLFIPSRTLRL